MQQLLWEILVPAYSNSLDEFSIEYHKEWDRYVQAISKGLTIFKRSKGIWISSDNQEFKEEMIPVRICCSQEEIRQIADFTARYYQQKAIMFYVISMETYIINYDSQFERIEKDK